MSSFDSGNTSAANAKPNTADAEPIDVSIAEPPKEDTSYDRSTSNSASTAGLTHAVRRHLPRDRTDVRIRTTPTRTRRLVKLGLRTPRSSRAGSRRRVRRYVLLRVVP